MTRDTAIIMTALDLMKSDAEFNRIDEINPRCPGCNRRDSAKHIFHVVQLFGRVSLVCAECADQDDFNNTGCRYGNKRICAHEDCGMSEDKPLLCNLLDALDHMKRRRI